MSDSDRSYHANSGVTISSSQGALTVLGGLQPTRISGRLARVLGDLLAHGQSVTAHTLATASGATSDDVEALLTACVERGILIEDDEACSASSWSPDEAEQIACLRTDASLSKLDDHARPLVAIEATSGHFRNSMARSMLRVLATRPNSRVGDEVAGPHWVVVQVAHGADLEAELGQWLSVGVDAVLPIVIGSQTFTVGPWVDERTDCLACLSERLTTATEPKTENAPESTSIGGALLAAAQTESAVLRRHLGGGWLPGRTFQRHDLSEWTSEVETAFGAACPRCRAEAGALANSSGDMYLQSLEVDQKVPVRPTAEEVSEAVAAPNDGQDRKSIVIVDAADLSLSGDRQMEIGGLRALPSATSTEPTRDGLAEFLRLGVGYRELPADPIPGGPRRWAPSGGNFGAPEVYGINLGPVRDVPPVFHYDKGRHAFAAVGLGATEDQRTCRPIVEPLIGDLDDGMVLVVTFDRARLSRKYERAYQLGHLDCGVALTHLRLAALRRGWRLTALAHWDEQMLCRSLRLDAAYDVIAAVAHVSWSRGAPNESQ